MAALRGLRSAVYVWALENKDMDLTKVRSSIFALGRDTLQISWELIRIMVPVIIVVRILEEMGAISVLSSWLAPVMGLIGLPGELGLVWATSMLTTLYGGMAVFAALAPVLDLTVAQVTVLCSAMLIAHSLPIELSISKKAGAPLGPIALLRLVGAVVYCYLLDQFCLQFSIWQEPATLLFSAPQEHLSIVNWSLEQLRNLGLIILIIFCILLLMRFLRSVGILTLLENCLAPILPIFGMSRAAAPITVVGMIMGIGYGGALIIMEANKGLMDKREIFNSLAMMALCHGLVEDTLLMVALGAKLGGILWGRIAFALIVTFLLVQILNIFSGRVKCSS